PDQVLGLEVAGDLQGTELRRRAGLRRREPQHREEQQRDNIEAVSHHGTPSGRRHRADPARSAPVSLSGALLAQKACRLQLGKAVSSTGPTVGSVSFGAKKRRSPKAPPSVSTRVGLSYLVQVPPPFSRMVPGPGSPVTVSIVLVPVAGMQKVEARTPVCDFGYVVSGSGGCGGLAFPVRVRFPLASRRKQGWLVLLTQQAWLSPPLESLHTIVPGLVGSSTCSTHAFPVQLPAAQPPPPQSSFLGCMPAGSPGLALHGV